MTEAQKKLMKACNSLYLELPAAIAEDVKKIAQAVIDESPAIPQQGITAEEKEKVMLNCLIDAARGLLFTLKERAIIFEAMGAFAASQFKGYSREQMSIELRIKLRSFMKDVRKPTSNNSEREKVLFDLTENILNSLTNNSDPV